MHAWWMGFTILVGILGQINYLNSQECQKSKFKKNPKFHFVILKIKKWYSAKVLP